MYRRPSIEKESFAERDTQTPAYVDGPCMYVSGSPYGDEGGQELRWRDKQIERGKQQEEERERERVYWFEGLTMPSFRLRIHGRIIEFSRL